MSIVIKGRTVYGPNIVTDGLVLYLDAANIKSYPGSGSTWYDLSGKNNNIGFNQTTFNTDNGGNIVFDGLNDYGKANVFDLSSTDKISLCFWIKFGSTTERIIMEHSENFNSSNAPVSSVNYLPGRLLFSDHHTAGYNISYTANSYADSNWHYFCATSDRSLDALTQTSLYVDAIFDKILHATHRANLSGNYSSYPLYIGSRAGGSYFLSGSLGIVKIYNRAISETEIIQNYNAMKGRYL